MGKGQTVATPFSTPDICAGYADVLTMTGAGLTLFGQPVESSDVAIADLEDWQFVLGHGPAHDAYSSGSLVEVADTGEEAREWGGWTDKVRAADIGAVFSFPVLFADHCVGALTFYDRTQRALTVQERLDGERCGHLAAATAGIAAADDDPQQGRGATLGCATGVLIARLHIDAADAESRIRAYSADSGRTLRAVVDALVNEPDLWES